MSEIGFDSRAVTIDGRRTLLLSGAIHYPRSTPEMWPLLMRRSRQAGLNAVETYVFWNLHEARRGVLDFSGRLDLRRFCQAAADEGLHVVLRIGPYVCAETNLGGFPSWLLRAPGIRMRTFNEPFMAEMERWTRLLCDYVRPMLAPAGGPIILAQVENEYDNIARFYGQDGQKYLQWSIDMGRSLNLGVPWIMCQGGVPGAISTINGFHGHPGLVEHLAKHPDQPGLWTEAYPGWYDTFGYAHHDRPVENLAFAILRFIAAGGSGINYYMWQGGTNFARESMYLQATSYDFSAPLDEYGLETTKSRHLSRLHKLLAERADWLLAGPPAAGRQLAPEQWAYSYEHAGKRLVFLCNDAQAPAGLDYQGRRYDLPAQSVSVTEGQEAIFNTAKVQASDVVKRRMAATPKGLDFQTWPEPHVADWPDELRCEHASREPLEQLQFTLDQTDYCWYRARLKVAAGAGAGKLEITAGGDVFHVFIDGRRVADTRGPLAENRVLRPQDQEIIKTYPLHEQNAYSQCFEIKLPPGEHELAILCCAMGLVKGDWQLGQKNMAEERKGLWGPVLWNGRQITGWRIQPGLVGEQVCVFGRGGAMVKWKPVGSGIVAGPRWFRATFARPRGGDPLAVDMAGMTKGMIYLNGLCAGRYWLVAGDGPEPAWVLNMVSHNPDVKQPTQRYYHLPLEWLRDHNTLVIFEEVGGDACAVKLCRRK